MRIPSKITAAESSARSSRTTKSGGKNTPKAKTAATRDSGVSASVSAKARSLANQAAGYDVAKVERLRDLIDKGELIIDFQYVAEQILQRG
jgi:flagellar biosynthesis anti-sigma factor FlgM